MARVHYVKKAQARYRTVPVLDDDGTAKVITLTRADGSPRTTKTGRVVTRRITVEDKSQPLPNHHCEKCGNEIRPGDPYRWVKPKSGPYGGSTRVRCGACPAWQSHELSNALWAQIEGVTSGARESAGDCTDKDAVAAALNEAAEGIREIADAKEEAGQNIEDGFQHETEQSTELKDQADQLRSWADDIESKVSEVEGMDEPDEEVDCDECDGAGSVNCTTCDGVGTRPPASTDDPALDEVECDACDGEGSHECENCGGTGQVENEDGLDEFHSELESALDVLDENPV